VSKTGAIMVLGSGIGGIQASLDLAEQGFKVYLVDKRPSIGGVMAQLDKTFPTNDCAMCLLSPKLVDAARHPNIEIITYAELEKISGEAGDFTAVIRKKPRFIKEDKCTGCGLCVANCPVRNIPHFEQKKAPEPKLEKSDLETITKILNAYKNQKGSIVPILQDINEEYKYLPEDILNYVSHKLDIPLSQVYNIATFYNAFSLTPRGKYTIQVCLGTACHVKGAQRILDAVQRQLSIKAGETTEDRLFSLEAVRCLGCCGLAPVMTVGDDLYGNITQAKIPNILKKYREGVEAEHAEIKA
jgi:NADH:ubiquinone oxidoreductase subunit E